MIASNHVYIIYLVLLVSHDTQKCRQQQPKSKFEVGHLQLFCFAHKIMETEKSYFGFLDDYSTRTIIPFQTKTEKPSWFRVFYIYYMIVFYKQVVFPLTTTTTCSCVAFFVDFLVQQYLHPPHLMCSSGMKCYARLGYVSILTYKGKAKFVLQILQ